MQLDSSPTAAGRSSLWTVGYRPRCIPIMCIRSLLYRIEPNVGAYHEVRGLPAGKRDALVE